MPAKNLSKSSLVPARCQKSQDPPKNISDVNAPNLPLTVVMAVPSTFAQHLRKKEEFTQGRNPTASNIASRALPMVRLRPRSFARSVFTTSPFGFNSTETSGVHSLDISCHSAPVSTHEGFNAQFKLTASTTQPTAKRTVLRIALKKSCAIYS